MTNTIGVDDLKGKLLQQRTLGKKNGEADILMNLFILARQAEHEMKNGDPIVSSLIISLHSIMICIDQPK